MLSVYCGKLRFTEEVVWHWQEVDGNVIVPAQLFIFATCVLTPAEYGRFVPCHHMCNVHEKCSNKVNVILSQKEFCFLSLSPIVL